MIGPMMNMRKSPQSGRAITKARITPSQDGLIFLISPFTGTPNSSPNFSIIGSNNGESTQSAHLLDNKTIGIEAKIAKLIPIKEIRKQRKYLRSSHELIVPLLLFIS